MAAHQDSVLRSDPLTRVTGNVEEFAARVGSFFSGLADGGVFLMRSAAALVRTSGGQVAVFSNNAIGGGLAPLNAHSSLAASCVLKPILAGAVCQTVDAGLLTFDTEVRRILPLFDRTASHELTVRDLLTHTSGLTDQVSVGAPAWSPLPASDTLRGRYGYTVSVDWYWLGRLLEAVYDRPVVDVLREMAAGLGMTDTHFTMRVEEVPTWHPFWGQWFGDPEWTAAGPPRPSGMPFSPGVDGYATLPDIARLYAAILTAHHSQEGPLRHIVARENLYSRCFAEVLNTPLAVGFGVLWDLNGWRVGRELSRWSFGHLAMFGSLAAIVDLQRNLVMVIMYTDVLSPMQSRARLARSVAAVLRALDESRVP